MSEKPTPETDAELDRAGRYLHGEILDCTPSEIQYVEAHFARRLERERDAAREALRELVELCEFWINREDTRDKSESEWKTWHALGHGSNAMRRARALLGKGAG